MLRFQHTKNGRKEARKARKKIKTIVGRLVREIARNLDEQRLLQHQTQLDIYQKVLLQKRSDSNKIYGLHESEVKCFTKGKEHKKFEFGSKAALLVTQTTNVIVGALNFSDNIHDSKTLPTVIEQYERLTGNQAKSHFCRQRLPRSKDGKRSHYLHAQTTNKHYQSTTQATLQTHSHRTNHWAFKHDYRLIKNYLKGTFGDTINLMLSAAAMNCKRVMNLWLTGANFCWKRICYIIANIYWIFYAHKLKGTFDG